MPREKHQLGSNIVVRQDYDPLTFRLSRILATSGSTTYQDITYFYDAVGNIVKKSDVAHADKFHNNQTVKPEGVYLYDPLYRLVEAKGREHAGQLPSGETEYQENYQNNYWSNSVAPEDANGWCNYTEKYLYDKMGNILELNHEGQEIDFTRTYNYGNGSTNKLASTTIGNNTISYSHDVHGNMTMPHLTRCIYNLLDQLQETSTQSFGSGDPIRTYYQYDGNGDRTRKVTYWQTATGQTPKLKSQRIYLDDYEVFIGYDADGTTINAHTHSQHIAAPKEKDKPLERFAMVDTDALTSVVTVQQFLSDHLGSASITIYNGNRVAFEEYHPFGTSSYRTGSMPLRYRYCGKERDEESGLYYYGMRYYVPWLCRFISVDPLKDKYPYKSTYDYAENRPISGIDLDGLEYVNKTEYTSHDPNLIGPPSQDQSRSQDLNNFLSSQGYDLNNTISVGKGSKKAEFLDLRNKQLNYDEKNGFSLSNLPSSIAGNKVHDFINSLPTDPSRTHNRDYFSREAANLSFKDAGTWLNSGGMCTATSMKRFDQALGGDKLDLVVGSKDYAISNSYSKITGFGVGQALINKGLASPVSSSSAVSGGLQRGAAMQFWDTADSSSVLSGIQNKTLNGHSTVFHGYTFSNKGFTTGFIYSDYGGFNLGEIKQGIAYDKYSDKISIFGANLK